MGRVRAITHTIGRYLHSLDSRRVFLAALSLMLLNTAYRLLFPTYRDFTSPMFQFVSDAAPLGWWGSLHLVVGAACLSYVFRKRDQIGYYLAMSMILLWALLAFLGWLAGEVERGYSTALIYIVFAVAIAAIGMKHRTM